MVSTTCSCSPHVFPCFPWVNHGEQHVIIMLFHGGFHVFHVFHAFHVGFHVMYCLHKTSSSHGRSGAVPPGPALPGRLGRGRRPAAAGDAASAGDLDAVPAVKITGGVWESVAEEPL